MRLELGRIVKKAMLVVVAIAVAGEILLHLQEAFIMSPEVRGHIDFRRALALRIYRLWLENNTHDRFVPPFVSFANVGIDDEQRLKSIVSAMQLPPSKEWESFDFLQAEKNWPQSRYRIRSNSLGFRGQEVTAAKGRDVTRIIALGDYRTFGHGVADDEAYPAQVEMELNRSQSKRRFEVWNAGHHTATAIVGLARLKNDIMQYHPDLILLEYGFVDPLISVDRFMPFDASSLGIGFEKAYFAFAKVLFFVAKHSRLFGAFEVWRFASVRDENLARFLNVMRASIAVAKSKGVPVIVVRGPLSFPIDAYNRLVEPGVSLVIANDVFNRTPSTLTKPLPGFWTEEFSEDFLKRPEAHHWAYRLNGLQLNRDGHRVLAKGIAEEVSKQLGL